MYKWMDLLLKEVYEFHEKFYTLSKRSNSYNVITSGSNPSPDERYELILKLDSKRAGIIEESDFVMIEQRCFVTSLSKLRAKKVKFVRNHFWSYYASDHRFPMDLSFRTCELFINDLNTYICSQLLIIIINIISFALYISIISNQLL